jgi:cellobiose phosphorylase
MQGGNSPGGLGLDREFFESVMVPQIMIYGFLGLKPTPEGCSIDPRLPAQWPSLTISRIHLHDKVIEIRIDPKERTISITGNGITPEPLVVKLPAGWRLESEATLAVQ